MSAAARAANDAGAGRPGGGLLMPASKARYLAGVELLKQGTTDESRDVSRFVHAVIDTLCGKAPAAASLDVFGELLGDARRPVLDAYASLLSLAASRRLSDDAIAAELRAGRVADGAAQAAVCEAVGARRDELLAALRRVAASGGGGSSWLRDFDWKLVVSVSSNSLATLREPRLLLSLALAGTADLQQQQQQQPQRQQPEQPQEQQQQEVLLELTRPALDRLLSSLETVSQAVQDLTVATG